MNVENDESDLQMLFVDFNQDASRISVGTRKGYRVYDCDPLHLSYEKAGDGTCRVEMLFNTSLIAHVGSGHVSGSSQRCLRIINTKRDKEIIRLNYGQPVLNVRMNRQRLIVVLEKSIYIYDVTNMQLCHTIASTPSNPLGICALANGHVVGESLAPPQILNYLAYPSSEQTGELFIYDAFNLRHVTTINAHSSPLGFLALSNKGDRLATASVKGTVIRVFNTQNGQRLCEFRRGLATNASIRSMSFNVESTLLVVSSNKTTVHIFKVPSTATPSLPSSSSPSNPSSSSQPPTSSSSSQGWGSMLYNAVGVAVSYFPESMTELWTQERSFAHISLPPEVAGFDNLSAVISHGASATVYVVTANGLFLRYQMKAEGGECVLEVTNGLLSSSHVPLQELEKSGPSTENEE